ncbi:MAG TPA: crossover junction endodeoxyribonuclease RuvC [Acidimicrobiales bacterium]|nr:crossover junction endodeoxyribonuclease RuvC [Acidimicrobiales bacterium]
MFVLGIDPGVSRCGYGALARRGGRTRAVAVGVIATPPSDPLPERLASLDRELRALLSDLRAEAAPTDDVDGRRPVVAVERLFFQVNARTAMSVGQASGLVLAAATQAGWDVVQYTPNEVKQAVAGYGAASKDQVQRMVTSLLGLPEPPRPADAADALALALCHLAAAPLAARVAGPRR